MGNPRKLNDDQAKEVVRLKDKEGLSYYRIGKMFNISPQVIMNTYKRAKQEFSASEIPDKPLVVVEQEQALQKVLTEDLELKNTITQLKNVMDEAVGRTLRTLKSSKSKVTIRELAELLKITIGKIQELTWRNTKSPEALVFKHYDWDKLQIVAREMNIQVPKLTSSQLKDRNIG